MSCRTSDGTSGSKTAKAIKKEPKSEIRDDAAIEAEYDMDNYDEDEEDDENQQMELKHLISYSHNRHDPHFINPEEEDSDEEREDFKIKDTDNLILAGHIEGDASILGKTRTPNPLLVTMDALLIHSSLNYRVHLANCSIYRRVFVYIVFWEQRAERHLDVPSVGCSFYINEHHIFIIFSVLGSFLAISLLHKIFFFLKTHNLAKRNFQFERFYFFLLLGWDWSRDSQNEHPTFLT